MKILADGALPGLAEAFPEPFQLTTYQHNEEVSSLLRNQDILLCRSTLKVNEQLLKDCMPRYVGTASSGIDHIDEHYLKQKNITLLDAKGCNANAVADYILASVAYLQQQLLLTGNQIGIVGLGAVGSKVAQRLAALNFQLICYDPLKSEFNKNFISASLEELRQCDLICIHANLHTNLPYPSKNLFNRTLLSQLKPNSIIINAARGGIVDEQALVDFPIIYCTDVFLNEPCINPAIVDYAYLCTPHIAGHSIEAKYNAVIEVSKKIHQRLNLPLPQYAKPPACQTLLDYPTSWQECALSLYNPIKETTLLKQADDKTTCFQRLRKAHQNRHDLCALTDLRILGIE